MGRKRKEIIDGKLTCSKCGEKKSTDAFCRDKHASSGHCSYCKECRLGYFSKTRQQRKDSYLKRSYGIDLEEYRQMYDAQSGVCAICGRPESQITKGTLQDLSVDHNHLTGHVRGLLCNRCNWQLMGELRDEKEKTKSLVRYLQKALNDDLSWEK
jgi:hypothetical protein